MTEKTPSNNIISLRHHLETLLREYRESHAREHELLADSVEHTRENLEIRLEGMNQFRAQILSERGAMVSNDRFEVRQQALEHLVCSKIESAELRIAELEKGLSNLKGKMTAIAAAISVGLVIVQMLLHFLVK